MNPISNYSHTELNGIMYEYCLKVQEARTSRMSLWIALSIKYVNRHHYCEALRSGAEGCERPNYSNNGNSNLPRKLQAVFILHSNVDIALCFSLEPILFL